MNRDLLEKPEEDEGSEYFRLQDAVTASLLSSSEYEDVTWVTQGTVNHLRRAAIVADAWKVRKILPIQSRSSGSACMWACVKKYAKTRTSRCLS